ncbi:MAG: hypothetical protein RL660_977 [Bacteroidota bacterium]|jgi:hypothetical protein
MQPIQLLIIVCNIAFVGFISKLIMQRKLREEYAIVWGFITIALLVFSFWRKGIDIFAKLLGVFDPPNLLFATFVFLMLIYLLHLSVVASTLQKKVTTLTQELAILKAKLENATTTT